MGRQESTQRELGSCQNRLTDAQSQMLRKIAETQMQLQAVQIQSMEGISASTRMLNDLKEDQAGFREKIAKHISVLQLDNGNQSEAIAIMEQQKKRLRLEFDAVAEDYKEYVNDMDSFNQELKMRVDRLFKSMQPTKVEWRVGRVLERKKE